MKTTTDNQTPQRNEIESFESRYNYDATYMKEMLEGAPDAYRVFRGFLPMAQFRHHADPDVYFTAKITAFRVVDCGPCLQLAIRTAREAGVEPGLIRAVLSPDEPLPPPLEQVRTFSRAILMGASHAETLREKLVDELGTAVVMELTLATASAQVFPVLKRAMGHYQSCSVTDIDI